MSTNGCLRLLGIDPNAKDDEVSEEEIRMMLMLVAKMAPLTMQNVNLFRMCLNLMIFLQVNW